MKRNKAQFPTKTSKPVIPAKAGIHFNQPLRWIPAFAPQALRFAKR